MEDLINDILSKKELQNLDNNIAKKEVNNYFLKNSKAKKLLEENNFNKRSAVYKVTAKDIRKILREIYGVFIEKDYQKRGEYLKDGEIDKILELHKSTKERLPYYREVYSNIFSITGIPKKILDLACGLNPVSYSYLGFKPEYIASDLSSKDLEFIDAFLKKYGIKGNTIKIDLINEQNKLTGLKTDVCFLFKTIDSLESRKPNIAKDLINVIESKWIIISFPKISLGGAKQIKKNKRAWLLNHLKNKGFTTHEFEVRNELFIITKSP